MERMGRAVKLGLGRRLVERREERGSGNGDGVGIVFMSMSIILMLVKCYSSCWYRC